ncbi:MAG: caspase family protein [Myxococcaceae bacterium]|nr:caspase family protein [Myxococcaceae bacterium]
MSAGRLALVLGLCLGPAISVAETRRVAIVVGNNAGGPSMPPLRFAESDAGKMARVLVELGEVAPDDILLLQGRRAADVERAITDAKERIAMFKRSPDVRTVLVFYFSGHSDGEAMELGLERLPYARLKALLSGAGADVRVSIVDACKSGAGIREKGGRPAEAFVIKLADTLQQTGEAFITSSAADEAALESNEVMGSYFTHNLISGLRGAADTSGDRLVTLAEAYRYAYDRTVSATAALSVGVQHPSYDFKLSGQGELVLASLLKPSSVLVLPEGADRALVTDVLRDHVVVEAPAGAAREFAVAPGEYSLRLFKGGQGFAARLKLAEGQRRAVAWGELTPVTSAVVVAAKGGAVEVSQQMDEKEDTAPIGLSLAFGATGRVTEWAPNDTSGLKYQLRVGVEPLQSSFGSFNLFGRPRLGRARVLGELTLQGVGEATTEATRRNEYGLQLRVGYRVAVEWWRLHLGLGLELGGGMLLAAQPTSGALQPTGLVVAAPRLSLRLRLAGPVWLHAEGEFPVLLVPFQEDAAATVTLRPYGFAALSAGLFVAF